MGTDSRHGLRSALAALLLLGLSGVPARADDAAAPAPLAASDKLSMEQLEEIVGPVALYPDIVLSAIMPASTDPVNLAKLAQWLAGQTAPVTEIPKDQNFGESVEAMVQYPDVVAWMNQNLDWVDQMGWAVTYQQEDVLKAVQSFRQKCKASGNLESNDKMVVETEQVPAAEGSSTSTQVIVIESAQPSVVYVPTYVPSQVCCYPSPTPLLSFGLGVAVGAAGAWAMHSIGWGYGGAWGVGYHGGNAYHGGDVNINRNTNVNVNNNNFNGSRSQPWNPAGAGAPRPKPYGVKQPSAANWNSAGAAQRPAAAAGVRAPTPSTLPAGAQRPGAAPARPTAPPASPAFSGDRGAAAGGDSSRGNASLGSGGKAPKTTPAPARPAAPSAKPSPAPARPAPSAKPTPSPSSSGAFGGGSGSGSSARSASSRGNSSTGRSGSAPSGGGSRGGGGGGGGGRGGGRR